MPLTNLDVVVDHDSCTDHEVPVTIRGHGLEIELTYDVRGGPHFRYGGTDEAICLERHGASCTLIDYLNERPLSLHTVELGTLRGSEYHEPWNPDEAPFDPNCVDPIDFNTAGVCINTEVGIAGGGKLSIFEFIEARIPSGSAPVVFCDHGSGEIADYIEIREIGDETEVEIYHCKSTKSTKPGARVDDAYEVIGQAIKSARWCERMRIRAKIEYRMKTGNRFRRGAFADVERLLSRPKPPFFHITVVQPGFAGRELTIELQQLMAGAHFHLRHAVVTGFRVLTSP